MLINFYKMDLDARVADKSNELQPITSINVKLKKRPNNIRRFNIDIEADPEDINFNYAYIDKFKRWYFVGEPVSIVNGLTQLPLDCDLLMTAREDIYDSTQLVERNAKFRNAYLDDPMMNYAAYETIACVSFPETSANVKDTIILITAG